MFRKILLTGVALMLLSGCNEANVQPGSGDAELVDPHSSEGRAELAAQLGGEPLEPIAVTQGDMSGSLQNQLDQLTGRLTLLQEQVIQIRSLTQQTLEQSQMNMTRLQSQSDSQRQQGPSVAGAEEAETGYLESAVNDIDQAVAQLLSAMSMQSPQMAEASGPFRVATAFTRNGWILIRFHAQTGETWLADNNSWQPLRDNASLNPSSYEVQVQRADTDSKGYVAVRIDNRDGRSWWLNDNTWQVLN
ncbi:hypothetical protein [Nitrincola sp. A-D6]|uniref:hypothetical protein n=1 Tax=Nitrincola sp. A-D6 TaxID=1545442 RepID=UPI0011871717|nr:hypothetical protein [Nitrincola sp. A-D6]